MSIMADSGLEVGTIIECKTQHGQELKGEVAAWDLNRKALVIGMHFVLYLNANGHPQCNNGPRF